MLNRIEPLRNELTALENQAKENQTKYEDVQKLISDLIGEERLVEFKGKHKLDVCFVYAAEITALRQAPGGRENSKMFAKAYFDVLADTEVPGADYYLRPDRILAAFHLDAEKPPEGYQEAKLRMEIEKRHDQEVQAEVRALENNQLGRKKKRKVRHSAHGGGEGGGGG